MIHHVPVDREQITAQVGELAERFGVRTPLVELGDRTPEWCVDGVYPQFDWHRPTLTIGPAFGALTPAEQRGALAEAMLSADLQRTRLYRFLIAAVIVVVAQHLIVGHLAKSAILAPIEGWQWTLKLTGCIAGLVLVYTLWARGIIYQLDRRMVTVLGRETVAATLSLDERSRTSARGIAGGFLRLTLPSKTRRTKRIGTNLGRDEP
ncbi:Uncharacterised protein [Nocardia asteroides]|nr:hypothetical protein SAMN05444423_10426 [Nocardia asteroides]VEG33797.1 Uncharacterised protein [Nocardia asteroides]